MKKTPKITIETRITEFAAVYKDGSIPFEKRGRSPQEALGALILNDPHRFGIDLMLSWGASRHLAVDSLEKKLKK